MQSGDSMQSGIYARGRGAAAGTLAGRRLKTGAPQSWGADGLLDRLLDGLLDRLLDGLLDRLLDGLLAAARVSLACREPTRKLHVASRGRSGAFTGAFTGAPRRFGLCANRWV